MVNEDEIWNTNAISWTTIQHILVFWVVVLFLTPVINRLRKDIDSKCKTLSMPISEWRLIMLYRY